MSWGKAVFETSKPVWPTDGVPVLVYYQVQGERFFVPFSTLYTALGVSASSLPGKCVETVPANFTLDGRVRNVIFNDQLMACVRDSLPEEKKINVARIVDSIKGAIPQSISDEEDEDEEAQKTPKRTREEEPPAARAASAAAEPLVAVLSNNQLASLEKRLATAIIAEIRQHMSEEAQKAAALLVLNSPDFKAKRDELMRVKLRELEQRTEAAYNAKIMEKQKQWEAEIRPLVEQRIYEEARRTSLPKAQEEATRAQLQQVAREVFTETVPPLSQGLLIADSELDRILNSKSGSK